MNHRRQHTTRTSQTELLNRTKVLSIDSETARAWQMARCRNTLEEDRPRFVFGFLCFPLGAVRSISANSEPRISFSGGSLPATLRRSMSCGLNAPSISSSTGFYPLSLSLCSSLSLSSFFPYLSIILSLSLSLKSNHRESWQEWWTRRESSFRETCTVVIRCRLQIGGWASILVVSSSYFLLIDSTFEDSRVVTAIIKQNRDLLCNFYWLVENLTSTGMGGNANK